MRKAGYAIANLTALSNLTMDEINDEDCYLRLVRDPAGNGSKPPQFYVWRKPVNQWQALAITDEILGARTINQAEASPANSGSLTQLLGWLAGQIKALSGEDNWLDPPLLDLAGAAEHVTDSENPHGVTALQVGAPSLIVETIASLPSATDGKIAWVSDAITSWSGWSNTPGAVAIAVGGAWRSQADGLPLSTQPYYRQITADATLNANNRIVRATGGDTITLASAASCAEGIVRIKNRSSNLITILSNSGEQIDGAASAYLTPDAQLTFRVFDSANWDRE